MINVYPSNRLENLVPLYAQVVRVAPLENTLQPEIVLVQSKGMRHWLSLQLAGQVGISMNMRYLMPVQFFWWLIRQILGHERVPETSPYSREVMSWRLFDLLAGAEVTSDPHLVKASAYWRGPEGDDELKRFQLAQQLADLFEQYLIYRPDWIERWERGSVEADNWQALLWRRLTNELPEHPLVLYRQALAELPGYAGALPARIALFGINAMPPLWLKFLSAIGARIQVHLFHLNPCVAYWGELQSEKQAAKQARWLGGEPAEIGCPILANLGGQGREFLALLQDETQHEIPFFESAAAPTVDQPVQVTALQRLQHDILELEDARVRPQTLIDYSLVFVSAHSALREVQGLHDWLLHQFNRDPELKPRDILVMAPRIELYAPYAEAVFTGRPEAQGEAPHLPCTLADRMLQEAEPLIGAFSELLDLPDSRLPVTQILGLLRLPALQSRFRFSGDDVETLSGWLRRAAVHWGLDAEHRGQVLGLEQVNGSFTWEQGLRRLLLGFAQGDRESVYGDLLLLPDVEGDEGLLLGRLIELIGRLRRHARELRRPRSIPDWLSYLLGLAQELFSAREESDALEGIAQAVEALGDEAGSAGISGPVALPVVREYLRAHFSAPEPGRRFLAGKVTFCSLVPMRSLPFKIIAILGLNDGEFPRQRIPLEFDLIADDRPRPGDRSRRGDDRYLFLEALISARDKLYLSYQGRDIKTNEPRQPSLVLSELMDYLSRGYGWSFGPEASTQLRQLPMQPFSPDNYRGEGRSFSQAWFRLAQHAEPRHNLIQLPLVDESAESVSLEELVRFFDNPARAFAQQRLRLFLEQPGETLPDDCEPFASDALQRYLLKDELVRAALAGQEREPLLRHALLSGDYPDNPRTAQELSGWDEEAGGFAAELRSRGLDQVETQRAEVELGGLTLIADLPWVGGELAHWRLAQRKGKDDLRLWLYHLLAHCLPEFGDKQIVSRGFFRDDKGRLEEVRLSSVDDARLQLGAWLERWRRGLEAPLLLTAAMAHALYAKEQDQGVAFRSGWVGGYNRSGWGSDPYLRWFWPDAPNWDEPLQSELEAYFQPLYQHLEEVK